MVFKSVLLSGGGVRGVAMLGALAEIKDQLAFCEAWVGVSVGGLIAALLLAGCDADEILRDSRLFEAVASQEAMEQTLVGLLRSRGVPPDTTLSGFRAMTKRTLVLVTTSLTTGKTVFLSHESAPETKLMKALLATSAVPLAFDPVLHDLGPLVDGCVGSPWPTCHPALAMARPTLAVRIRSDYVCSAEPESVANIAGIFVAGTLNADDAWDRAWGTEIVLDIEGVDTLDTTLEPDEVKDLACYGRAMAAKNMRSVRKRTVTV